MSSSTSASDFPGCAATSARRYSSPSYRASCMSEGSSPSNAARNCLRYSSIERGAEERFIETPRRSGAQRVSWRCSFHKSIDEIASLPPNATPLLEDSASLISNAVVAAGRPRIRRHNAAGQQTRRTQRSQHRIDRAFFKERVALVRLLQALGNLIAIEVFRTPVQDSQQHQCHQTRIQVFLEFAPLVLLVHGATVECTVLVVQSYWGLTKPSVPFPSL